jgi:NAD-reducing hydrogenase large subunit
MSSVRLSQAPAKDAPRKIVIDPVTRVEGHGKVTIRLNEAGKVEETRFHIVEFRGFERFIRGRMYWEVPLIIQRLCGICPVSHHLAAAKAMDMVAGVDRLTPTAKKMRSYALRSGAAIECAAHLPSGLSRPSVRLRRAA